MSAEPFIKIQRKVVPFRYLAPDGHARASEGYPCVWCDPQDEEDFADFPLILRKPHDRDKRWRLCGVVGDAARLVPLVKALTKKRCIAFIDTQIASVWRSHYRYIYALRLLSRFPEPNSKIAALAVAGRLLGLSANSKSTDIAQ